jgi:hypothetical protein
MSQMVPGGNRAVKRSHGAETSPGMGNDVGNRSLGLPKQAAMSPQPCQHWKLSML